MNETLRRVHEQIGQRTTFDARAIFGKRVGKMTVFPTGLGSALAKAVREGYLTVVTEGGRRRGKTYALTQKAFTKANDIPPAPAP